MNWLARLIIGGNLGLLAKSTTALIGLALVGAAVIALANVALGSSHYRAFRAKSDAFASYLAMQFVLSAAVILLVAFALRVIR